MLIWQIMNVAVLLKATTLLHPKMIEKENQLFFYFVLLTIKSG